MEGGAVKGKLRNAPVSKTSNEASPQTDELCVGGLNAGGKRWAPSRAYDFDEVHEAPTLTAEAVGGHKGRRLGARNARPHTVAEILNKHVNLEVECIDRMYLNVYVPQLQANEVWPAFSSFTAATSSRRRR